MANEDFARADAEMILLNSGTNNQDPDAAVSGIDGPTRLPRAPLKVPSLPPSRFSKPRVHYLHVSPHWCSLRWPLRYLHQDLIHSSSFAPNRPAAASMLKALQRIKGR
jgi:hypothetical protein